MGTGCLWINRPYRRPVFFGHIFLDRENFEQMAAERCEPAKLSVTRMTHALSARIKNPMRLRTWPFLGCEIDTGNLARREVVACASA